MSYSQDLLEFIDLSSTSFHAVENLKKDLLTQNYQELKEHEHWSLEKGGKYFVTRGAGSIIIFKTPKKWSPDYAFHIIGAHTDSPCLKVKSNPISKNEGYQLLNIEIYIQMGRARTGLKDPCEALSH